MLRIARTKTFFVRQIDLDFYLSTLGFPFNSLEYLYLIWIESSAQLQKQNLIGILQKLGKQSNENQSVLQKSKFTGQQKQMAVEEFLKKSDENPSV